MKIGKTIYLDHQATTPVDLRVFEQMKPFFSSQFGNPHSGEHAVGWRAANAVDTARSDIASMVGADPDEVFFTSGATESNNLGILGLCEKPLNIKRRIMVSGIEHKSVLEIAHFLNKNRKYRTELIPVDKNGTIDLNYLENNLGDDVALVSVMAVNNEIGSMQEVGQIGMLTSRLGIPFHCDAAQAPCAMNLDAISEHVDLLSLSSHKIYGPQGIGALFVRRELQNHIRPLLYGGAQQGGLRPGTIPVPLCVGMAAAAKLMSGSEAKEEQSRLGQLRNKFWGSLTTLGFDIHLNGSEFGKRHPGNLNVCFKDFVAQDIIAALQPRLAASSGSACASGIPEASYVLKAIGLSEEDAAASVRFSLGRFTTEEHIAEAVDMIEAALRRLSLL